MTASIINPNHVAPGLAPDAWRFKDLLELRSMLTEGFGPRVGSAGAFPHWRTQLDAMWNWSKPMGQEQPAPTVEVRVQSIDPAPAPSRLVFETVRLIARGHGPAMVKGELRRVLKALPSTLSSYRPAGLSAAIAEAWNEHRAEKERMAMVRIPAGSPAMEARRAQVQALRDMAAGTFRARWPVPLELATEQNVDATMYALGIGDLYDRSSARLLALLGENAGDKVRSVCYSALVQAASPHGLPALSGADYFDHRLFAATGIPMRLTQYQRMLVPDRNALHRDVSFDVEALDKSDLPDLPAALQALEAEWL